MLFKTVLCILLYANILSCECELTPRTELYDAFNTFVRFSPTLFGYNFTEQDEELYATSAKLQSVHLEIDELISSYGYPVEKYVVSTEDGYNLGVFRIRGAGRPVFLMHGLMLSADDWVTVGPENGLAFLLAAEGFDVWLGNARGTKHSRAHASLSPNSASFWDFSWDEIGRYDLPAMIDHVLRATNQSQLLYVGHSQGTTAFFVMAAERPCYNNKISLMVALAPIAAVPNLKSPILQFISYASLLHSDKLFALLRKYGVKEMRQQNALTKAVASTACAKSRIARAICSRVVFVMCGFNYPQLDLKSLPTVLSHLSSSVAFKQIEHYAQTFVSKRFARFDYGPLRNEALYGSTAPPEYNVSAISTPVALFYGADDWLGSETDTLILRKKLKNVVDFHKVRDQNFKHVDFLYAKDVRELVFKPMLKQIKKPFL